VFNLIVFFFPLAKFMGIPKISPILLTTADFSHGANFAIADATVLGSPPETVSFFFVLPPLISL